jgi:hypothetical protein
MEHGSVARKKPSPPKLATELQALNQRLPEDLFLPSLRDRPPRVHGYAFRFFLVLPLYTAEGRRVFTQDHLGRLHSLFDTRFGGCLAASSRSAAPFFGEYLPEGERPVRDYHTITIVYANPIEPSDRFFHELKAILRKAPLIEQEEILIERSEVYLV